MNVYIILGAVILVLGFSLYGASRLYYQQKAEIERYKKDLKNQKAYVNILLRHYDDLKGISEQKAGINEKIEKAENEKEVLDIINSIIADNNRVRDNAKK